MAFSFSNPFVTPTEVSTSADTLGTTDSQTMPAIPSPTTPPTTKLTPIPIPSSSTSKWSISTSTITPPPPDPDPLPIISSITTLASLTNSSTWLTPLPIASSTPTRTPLLNSSTSLLTSIPSARVTYSQSSSVSSSISSFSGTPELHKSGSKSLIHNKGVIIAGVSTFIALIVIIVIIILIKITIRRRRSKDSDNREEGEQDIRTNSRSSEFIGNDIGDDGGGGYDEAFRDHLYQSPSTQLKPGRSDAFHELYDRQQMGYCSDMHGERAGVESDDQVHECEEEGPPPYDHIG